MVCVVLEWRCSLRWLMGCPSLPRWRRVALLSQRGPVPIQARISKVKQIQTYLGAIVKAQGALRGAATRVLATDAIDARYDGGMNYQ